MPTTEDDETTKQRRLEFVAALEDDFQTPRALAVLDALADSATATGSAAHAATLRELGGVLGLCLPPTSTTRTEDGVLSQREA